MRSGPRRSSYPFYVERLLMADSADASTASSLTLGEDCSNGNGRIEPYNQSEASVNQGDDALHAISGSSVVSSLSLQVDGVEDEGDGDGVQELHAADEEQACGDAEEGYGEHDPDANNSDEVYVDASDEYLSNDDYVEESTPAVRSVLGWTSYLYCVLWCAHAA
ncbi:uncharacterized protein LOC119303869 [Triticum dicoccoides]|uniref:uncharacterized protein LOC119303869 n=1 Tax=Triticum dicoccoides TaxID=85692 RepID=UPI001890302E|nr:uncharacterized protein LOC119303869 [Triticum dicoccoides]